MTAAMQAASSSAPIGAAATLPLVGVSEAARQLGVHKSTISRQVDKGLIPNRGTPDRPLVNVDEARRARGENLDTSKQRGAGSALFGGGEDGVAKAPTSGPYRQAEASSLASPGGPTSDADDDLLDEAPDPRAAKDDSYVTESKRVKSLQGDMLARKLAEQDGLLVGKAGVEREFETLFQAMAERVSTAARSIAGQLATMTDEREIAQLLRQTLDQAMNELSAEANAAADVD